MSELEKFLTGEESHSEQLELKTKYVNKLQSILTIEAKTAYWINFISDELYHVIKNEEVYCNLTMYCNSRKDVLYIIEQTLMRNYDYLSSIEIGPVSLMKRFERAANDSIDIKVAKKVYLKGLDKNYKHQNTHLRYSLGFDAFDSLTSNKSIAEKIERKYKDALNFPLVAINFHIGYLWARFRNEIRNYEPINSKVENNTLDVKIIKESLERIEVKVSMPVFAATIYHFGVSCAMFPLVFKTNKDYNASATADYYRKRFKVLKNNSTEEVSEVQFKKCFKLTEMDLVDNEVLKALEKFPFGKLE